MVTWRERLARWIAPPPPDPIVYMLVRELNEAARALEIASAAMKHNRVTPNVTVSTRAAFRRAESIVGQTTIARKIDLTGRNGVDEYASTTPAPKLKDGDALLH